MAEAAPLDDGTVDFSGGQDAWHYPDVIQPNQYAAGINISTRGGVIGPRNGIEDVELTFENKTFKTKFGAERSYADIWNLGKFQAYIPLVTENDNFAITIVCGMIWKTNVRTGNTKLLSDKLLVNQYASRINWSYAHEQIVIFDYPNYPIIIDGPKVSRADPNHKIANIPAPQTPIARLGCYNENRLFIVNGGTQFTAGDGVGNLVTPEAPITFTETLTPSSSFYKQFFALPVDEGMYPITAAGFIQELDTNTGIGTLFLATQKKIYYFASNQPRSQWATTEQFGKILLANAGIAGPRAFVNVNSDLIFMSAEGKIHALSTARTEAKKWGNIPISREVSNFAKFSDPSLSRFAALGYFDNRIFITVNPYRVGSITRDGEPITDYAHGGIVPLEIEAMATLSTDGNPTWDGVWTGYDFMDFGPIEHEFYGVAKRGGGNVLCKMRKDSFVDVVRKNKRKVRSIVYTKEYNHQQPFTQKRQSTLMLRMQAMNGKMEVKAEYKSQHSTEFVEVDTWRHEAPTNLLQAPPSDEYANGVAAQALKPIFFGDPVRPAYNPVSGEDYIAGFAFQYRLTISGDDWRLKQFKTRAIPIPYEERRDDTSDNLAKIAVSQPENPDWLVPEEECSFR